MISFIFIFFIVWWLVWMAVLPFGVQRDAKPEKGNDHGAPVNPHLRIKLITATWLSMIITNVIMFVLEQGWVL